MIENLGETSLHYLDIMENGAFVNAGVTVVSAGTLAKGWAAIQLGVRFLQLLFHLNLYASRVLLE